MTHKTWLNLGSQNLKKTKEFYKKIGATINDKAASNIVSVTMGKNSLMINFFAKDQFAKFLNHDFCDAHKSNEIVFTIGVSDHDEVDLWAKRVREAGGEVYSKPQEVSGFMYNCAFSDPDGHNWNVLYMNLAKAPKEEVSPSAKNNFKNDDVIFS